MHWWLSYIKLAHGDKLLIVPSLHGLSELEEAKGLLFSALCFKSYHFLILLPTTLLDLSSNLIFEFGSFFGGPEAGEG
jgi:hypothetical protein